MTNYIYSPEHTAYVSFRRVWRTEYKQLSLDIRKGKLEFKTLLAQDKPHRAGAVLGTRLSNSLRASAMMEEITVRKEAWRAFLAAGHVTRTACADVAGAA